MSPLPMHVSGIEGASAEGEIAVAEGSVHPEPLAADDDAADEVDERCLGKSRPRVGRRP